ncbi:GFA family protein [Paraglaciecola sp.]|uniref:GFA family protein n=1 Tax=Paraglaciecola sp. TaxID=1920173 RepID=UPI0030F425A0
MSTRIAACSCGQLTATIVEGPIRVSICHCLACQRRTGSVFGVQARFNKASVTIQGQSRQYVRIGDEGGKATFSFCPNCGATVHYEIEGREDSMTIPVGAFAEPSFPEPTFSVYEERKHAWVGLPLGIEHMA